MTDPVSLLIVAIAFFGGGLVKGVAGMGLPIVTVAVLVFAFDLGTAMALMVVPGLATNAWQTVGAPHLREAAKRTASFLLPSLLTIWFGTGLLISLDNHWLVTILGLVLLAYAISNIAGWRYDVRQSSEWWLGPLWGLVNGISTGMTGVTSTPSVIYLNGLGLKREVFVQAMGLVFFVSYVILTLSLWMRGLVTPVVGGLSVAAMVPALVGMALGRLMRLRTSEAGFKWLFFRLLVAAALYLIIRSQLGN